MDRAADASPEQLNAQYEALQQIGGARVTYDARGIPWNVFGHTPYVVPKDIESSAGRAALKSVLAQIRIILLAEGTEELTLARQPQVQAHLRDIQFKQSIRGIPVSDSNVVLTVDDRTGKVAMISANFLPDRGLPREPKLTASAAVSAAVDWVQKQYELETKIRGEPVLSYRIGHVDSDAPSARLVWTVALEATSLQLAAVVVDALDGSIVATRAATGITREVYNSNGSTVWGTRRAREPAYLSASRSSPPR